MDYHCSPCGSIADLKVVCWKVKILSFITITHHNFRILLCQKGYEPIFKTLDYLLENFQLFFFQIALKYENRKQILIAVCFRTWNDYISPLLSFNESRNQIKKSQDANEILKVLCRRISPLIKPQECST